MKISELVKGLWQHQRCRRFRRRRRRRRCHICHGRLWQAAPKTATCNVPRRRRRCLQFAYNLRCAALWFRLPTVQRGDSTCGRGGRQGRGGLSYELAKAWRQLMDALGGGSAQFKLTLSLPHVQRDLLSLCHALFLFVYASLSPSLSLFFCPTHLAPLLPNYRMPHATNCCNSVHSGCACAVDMKICLP